MFLSSFSVWCDFWPHCLVIYTDVCVLNYSGTYMLNLHKHKPDIITHTQTRHNIVVVKRRKRKRSWDNRRQKEKRENTTWQIIYIILFPLFAFPELFGLSVMPGDVDLDIKLPPQELVTCSTRCKMCVWINFLKNIILFGGKIKEGNGRILDTGFPDEDSWPTSVVRINLCHWWIKLFCNLFWSGLFVQSSKTSLTP